MNQQTLAIFITSYNYGEFIGKAIESVINQSNPNWKLYIYDDNSTDNSQQIIKEYLKKDNRISWKNNKTNRGALQNMLDGFYEIQSDLIAVLCSDDWIAPNFVADALTAFSQTGQKNLQIPFVAFGSQAVYKNDKTNALSFHRVWIPFPDNFKGQVFLTPTLTMGNYVSLNALVYRRKYLLPILDKLKKLNIRQNYETFFIHHLEATHGAGYLNASCHVFWRRHNEQITAQNTQNFQHKIESVMLPLLDCKGDFALSENKNNAKILLCHKFLNLSIFTAESTGMTFRQSAEYLLSDLGKTFAEQLGNLDINFVRQNHLEKYLLAAAMAIHLALIFFAKRPSLHGDLAYSLEQLSEWILDLQKQYKFKNVEEMLHGINKTFYETANLGLFLPENLIKKLSLAIQNIQGFSGKAMAKFVENKFDKLK